MTMNSSKKDFTNIWLAMIWLRQFTLYQSRCYQASSKISILWWVSLIITIHCRYCCLLGPVRSVERRLLLSKRVLISRSVVNVTTGLLLELRLCDPQPFLCQLLWTLHLDKYSVLSCLLCVCYHVCYMLSESDFNWFYWE